MLQRSSGCNQFLNSSSSRRNPNWLSSVSLRDKNIIEFNPLFSRPILFFPFRFSVLSFVWNHSISLEHDKSRSPELASYSEDTIQNVDQSALYFLNRCLIYYKKKKHVFFVTHGNFISIYSIHIQFLISCNCNKFANYDWPADFIAEIFIPTGFQHHWSQGISKRGREWHT